MKFYMEIVEFVPYLVALGNLYIHITIPLYDYIAA